ncbi:hypothetical protein [Chitinophaga agri]|uniref:Uncharacterized protein n=1 Tax=Chitinophaga agri TaxID=2703787 RepID=A0A6B9ZBK5_9BACT|nr:hypothetical protein [Chitinophaga agri]QHS59782.1 hypothetical protein GWR21_09315 [Chitinophaga agri]
MVRLSAVELVLMNAADTLPALLASLHNVLKVTAKAVKEENKSDAKVH